MANGQGEMKGKLFRIAHIGYYDYLDTVGILAALEHVLASVPGDRLNTVQRCGQRRKFMRAVFRKSGNRWACNQLQRYCCTGNITILEFCPLTRT